METIALMIMLIVLPDGGRFVAEAYYTMEDCEREKRDILIIPEVKAAVCEEHTLDSWHDLRRRWEDATRADERRQS